jgi:hypothetical protein
MHRKIILALVGLTLNMPAWSQTSISYESPRAAYLALNKDPHAELKRNAGGWEIVDVSKGPNEGIWTFAPNSHASFPSVVKRQVVERNGRLFVGMDVLCGGTKSACDQYVAEFAKMNEQMKTELNDKRATGEVGR